MAACDGAVTTTRMYVGLQGGYILVNSMCSLCVGARSCCSPPGGSSTSFLGDAGSPLPQCGHLTPK